MPWEKLVRMSGIISAGSARRSARLTRAELDGLAAAWKVDPAQVGCPSNIA
jgi:hypothetical protein